MIIMYLCLTCLKLSSEPGDCHGRPLIRCDADEPTRLGTSPQLGLHPISKHWLLENLRGVKRGADDPSKN